MTAEVREAKVLYLNKPKRFSLEEARVLVPRVRSITREAVEETAPLVTKLQQLNLPENEREELSRDFQTRVNAWADEIMRLGAVPKGLWLVDFDSGGGYFCWRFDEKDLEFFHGYDDGFPGRTPIQ
jgi:hypothetical protein